MKKNIPSPPPVTLEPSRSHLALGYTCCLVAIIVIAASSYAHIFDATRKPGHFLFFVILTLPLWTTATKLVQVVWLDEVGVYRRGLLRITRHIPWRRVEAIYLSRGWGTFKDSREWTVRAGYKKIASAQGSLISKPSPAYLHLARRLVDTARKNKLQPGYESWDSEDNWFKM